MDISIIIIINNNNLIIIELPVPMNTLYGNVLEPGDWYYQARPVASGCLGTSSNQWLNSKEFKCCISVSLSSQSDQ